MTPLEGNRPQSTDTLFSITSLPARVAKLADARDLKSRAPKGAYRFDSDPGHHLTVEVVSTSVHLAVSACGVDGIRIAPIVPVIVPKL